MAWEGWGRRWVVAGWAGAGRRGTRRRRRKNQLGKMVQAGRVTYGVAMKHSNTTVNRAVKANQGCILLNPIPQGIEGTTGKVQHSRRKWKGRQGSTQDTGIQG